MRFERSPRSACVSGSYDRWKRYFRNSQKLFTAVSRGSSRQRKSGAVVRLLEPGVQGGSPENVPDVVEVIGAGQVLWVQLYWFGNLLTT